MKTLILAEKPDMGKKIAQTLGQFSSKNGYLENDSYIVTWAIGHLLGLAEPEAYDDQYKRWDMQHLPIIPKTFLLEPNQKTLKQLKIIQTVAKQCSQAINCCDGAREGEYIFRLIYQYLRLTIPVRRLWISSLTPDAIRKGFKELRNGSEYNNLYMAARSRSEADWLIGMNGTRAFSTKFGGHGNVLSIGRVQTPVLAMISDRHESIDKFQPQNYFEVEAMFQQESLNYKGIWQYNEQKILDRTVTDAIARKVQSQIGTIISCVVKEINEHPPALYDLGALQSEANRRFGFSAQKTLDIAQELYEKHEAISYPRTTSNYVAEDNIPVMHYVFNQFSVTQYEDLVAGGNINLVHTKNKNLCRPDKIEDHHAIFPTGKIPSDLTKEQELLFDLICRRFLSHFYPAAQYRDHTVYTEVKDEKFKTKVKELKDIGWKIIYDKTESETKEKDDPEEIKTNFNINTDQLAFCVKAETKAKVTSPPSWYTEGTLIDSMKRAGRNITDEELREELSSLQLGTPATRANIIEKLKTQKYIYLEGKKLKATDKGKNLIAIIRGMDLHVLTSPEMTAMWEKRLNEISKGQASEEKFMVQVQQFTTKIINKVKESTGISQDSFVNSIGNCPACENGKLIESNNGYGCSRFKDGCKFTIRKIQFGKTLSIKQINELLTKGKTGELKFKSKKENASDYTARLVLKNKGTGEIGLEFSNKRKNSNTNKSPKPNRN
ncbi:type IA DNA topoisomerase [Paenibacillus sp. Leaf72]|uniref:type IA DNA topoisomerase n=1 Tax=Paenibacillus sp. Leaf72 TaxID=1736234 RepID=UPI0006F3BEA4|nr:type IA DNA topoisomerase [Paenibacillus sp. Leaf72]KQN96767.1 hypothetical protein ASF12_22090 [Paenibacillus sp. Leaf72]